MVWSYTRWRSIDMSYNGSMLKFLLALCFLVVGLAFALAAIPDMLIALFGTSGQGTIVSVESAYCGRDHVVCGTNLDVRFVARGGQNVTAYISKYSDDA